jgi:outer membrane receptor protein involved in Fe transport
MVRKLAILVLGVIALQVMAPSGAMAAPAANVSRFRLAGTVTDTLGRPLPGADVALQMHNGHVESRSRTNSGGHFAFRDIPPGTYAAVANKAGFTTAVAIVTVTGSGAKPVTIAMQSEAALSLKVTAKRFTEARNALNPETGGSVYHFNRKAIHELPAGSNTSMSSVLLQAPGVVQDSYGQIHIRGEHAGIQYRINGIELPEGISSGFSETFSPRFAQSISLLVGALPAQYGYQTAGVVNIQTKSGSSLEGGDLEMYGGQRGTLEPSFELGGQKGKFSYYTTGYYLQDDRGLQPPTPGPVAIHDKTYQGDGFSYLSYFLSPLMRLSFIGGFNVSHFEIPNNPDQPPAFTLQGVATYPSAELNENQLEQNYYGVLALQGAVAGHLDYQLAGFSRYSTLSFSPDNIGDLIFNGVASRIFRGDWASGLQGDFAWRGFAGHTIRAGFYFQGERAEIDNHSLVFPGGPGFQTSFIPEPVVDDTALVEWLYGIYVQDEWKPLPKLTINYGVRFDLYDGLTRSDQASPRVGAVYQLFEGTTLHAAYARYFTPPPLEAVSGEDIKKFSGTTNQPAVLADSNISPERANYFDAGVTQRLPYNLKVGLDSYYKMSSDLLDEGQFGPTLIFTPFNYNKGRQYGVEFTTSWNHKNLTTYTNFAYSVAQGIDIVSDQFLFTADELAYIKNHYIFLDHDQTFAASWGAAYNWDGFLFTLDGLYGSGLRTGFANTGNLPFYIQFNAAIAKKVTVPDVGQIESRIAVINLGDWIYQIRSGSGIGVFAPQYGPRRAVYAGLTWFFPWSKASGVAQ